MACSLSPDAVLTYTIFAIAKVGCEVIFSPPYSPDLNKIEKFWIKLKCYVSRWISNGESLISFTLNIGLRKPS
ncbi:transposase [Synechocystis sp. PCC 6714]|uniref:transposase n=1 Tax=unclassified Synechocystis TaxID=2640012 RepID=UPI003510CB1A